MKILIAGGNGLIGKKLAALLEKSGHQIVAASRSTGVDLVTGEGLEEAIQGVDAVVDVLNSPSFEDQAVLEFFQATSTNLLRAETAAGVKHHVALSVVGSDRVPDSGYLRAKAAQENSFKQLAFLLPLCVPPSFSSSPQGLLSFRWSMAGVVCLPRRCSPWRQMTWRTVWPWWFPQHPEGSRGTRRPREDPAR